MSRDWVAIDFETANAWWGSICEVGMSLVEGGTITARHRTFIRPPGTGEFASRNVQLHGINASTVSAAPTWPEALRSILSFAGDRPLVAHNTAFDFGALRAACTETSTPWPSVRYACSLVVARQTWRLLTYRLPFVAEAAGVPMTGSHHDAQADADAAALVMLAAFEANGVDNLDDLLQKLDLHYGQLSPAAATWSNCRHRSSDGAKRRPPIAQANPHANPDGALYGRAVCFTGTLTTMTRSEAQDRLASVGGQALPGVSRKTDLLVVGTSDPTRFAPGMTLSSNHRKAQTLLDAGHDIEVVSEADFLELLASPGTAPAESAGPERARQLPAQETQARHATLTAQIEGHRFRYYVKDAPVISNAEFDQLVSEQQVLESAHPSLRHA